MCLGRWRGSDNFSLIDSKVEEMSVSLKEQRKSIEWLGARNVRSTSSRSSADSEGGA